MSKKRRDNDKHAGPLLWAVYVCAALAPLTFFLQSSLPEFRMTFVKGLAFQAVTAVMFGAWLVLAIADKRYRPRKSAIVVAVGAYAAALLVSLCFSIDPQLSFWSSERRMTGVVFLLHCIAWFLALSSTFRTREDWRPFLWIMSTVATVMAVIGIYQSAASSLAEPAIGALGNQSYLAAYLLISLFLTGYLLVGAVGKTRYALYTAMAAQAVAAALTASRGAIVVLAFSLLVGTAGFALTSRISRGRKLLAAGGAFALVLVLVGAFAWVKTPAGSDWASETALPHFVQRAAVKNFGDDRWILWDIALKGIAERPIFGWGGEQFETIFSTHYDPYGPGREIFFERWFDKAHNQYLDTLIAYGVVGLAAFAAIWIAVAVGFAAAFRRAAGDTDRRKLVMLALACIAYLAYSFFMFDTTSQVAVLFALLAFLSIALPEIAGRPSAGIPAPDARIAGTRVKFGAIIVVPALLIVIWFIDARPLVMAGKLHAADELMKTDRTAAAEEIPEALGGFNPYVHDFCLKSISAIIPFAESVHLSSSKMEALLSVLADEAAATAEDRPTNIRAQLAAAVMYRLLGEYDAVRLDDAERYAASAESVAPGNHAVYQEMADIRLLRKDPDGALELYDKALGMAFTLQREYAGAIAYRKSCAYAMKRDFGNMFAELEKANSLRFRSQYDVRLAEALGESVRPGDDIGAIAEYLDGNLKSYPDHPQLLWAAAVIFDAMGDEQRASAMIGELRKRDPAAADALQAQLSAEEPAVE